MPCLLCGGTDHLIEFCRYRRPDLEAELKARIQRELPELAALLDMLPDPKRN